MVGGVFFVGVLGGFPVGVGAFSVEPSIHDLQILPGSSVDRELIVKNTEDTPVNMVLSVQKFAPGTGGEPVFLDPSDTTDLPSWIRVSSPRFTLAPGESRRLRVQIAVPADAQRRGYYAAIFLAEQNTGESAVGFARRLATLWMISVGGAEDAAAPKIALQEEGVSADWGWFGRTGNTSFVVQNTGVVHGAVRVRTRVQAWPMGAYASSQDVRLLPDERRTVTSAWSLAIPAARLRVTHELLNDDDKVIGFFERRFWIAETVVLASFLSALILGAIARLVIRSRRKRFTV